MFIDNENNFKDIIHIKRNLKSVEVKSNTKNKKTKVKDIDIDIEKENDESILIDDEKLKNIQNFQK